MGAGIRTGARIDDPASLDPAAPCNTLFPIYGNARLAAGADSGDVEQCALKPVNPADYRGLTPPQQARLREVFADGVCDYSKPGMGQQPPLGEWQSFGPALPRGARDVATASK